MVVIVISGLSTCGSTTTGKMLAKKLGLKFFSVGYYYKKFSRGKETERAINFMKTRKGFGKPFNYYIDKLQMEKARKGNIIIESKMGIRYLKNIADFTVWLEAPANIRARRLAGRDNIPMAHARKELIEKEIMERKKIRKIYGFDPNEQKHDADLVVNTGHLTPEQVVNKIIREFKKRKITIAISGQPCTGSTTAASLLAKKLKFKTFIPGNRFKGRIKTSESAIKTWEDKGMKKKFHQNLDKIQTDLAKKGNIVIGGKLSVHLLSDIADFTAWLCAKKPTRIRRLIERENISKEHARKLLEKREKIERSKWKEFYGFDYFKQEKEADFLINTANKTPNQIVSIILKELKGRKII